MEDKERIIKLLNKYISNEVTVSEGRRITDYIRSSNEEYYVVPGFLGDRSILRRCIARNA